MLVEDRKTEADWRLGFRSLEAEIGDGVELGVSGDLPSELEGTLSGLAQVGGHIADTNALVRISLAAPKRAITSSQTESAPLWSATKLYMLHRASQSA